MSKPGSESSRKWHPQQEELFLYLLSKAEFRLIVGKGDGVQGDPHLRPRALCYSIAQDMCQHIFDRGGTLGLQDAQTLPALSAVAPADAAPANAAAFAMFRSGHLPEPTLDGLQGPPASVLWRAKSTPNKLGKEISDKDQT
jgi:hypothetical protein